jgi:arabinosaccharide transport system permease protein
MSTKGESFIHRRQVVPYVFLAPFLLFFLAFRVWPVIDAFILSFQDVQGIGMSEWNGLRNYARLLSDPSFFKSLRNTTVYTIGTLIFLVPLPLIFSQLLFSGVVARPNFFRLIIFLPVLTSLVVAGTVFRLLLAPDGVLNSGLMAIGLPGPRWLQVAELAVPSMVIVAIWRWTGMNIIYFTSGLTNIPHEMFEAAAIDGATRFQQFIHITVPMLKPVTIFVVTLTLISGYQVFAEPYILFSQGESPGEGGLTIALYLYRQAFRSFNMGYASTVGVVLALIIMIISLIQFRLFGFFSEED